MNLQFSSAMNSGMKPSSLEKVRWLGKDSIHTAVLPLRSSQLWLTSKLARVQQVQDAIQLSHVVLDGRACPGKQGQGCNTVCTSSYSIAQDRHRRHPAFAFRESALQIRLPLKPSVCL
jgi:hypothetical protein